HEKPIIVANIDGYWDPLEKLLQNMTAENYIPGGHGNLITFVARIDEILPILRSMPPATGDL
ncbi:MAG: LOG family protein, partial [Pseudomonadota bacterium]|nr:LOG family protein [Pseudomonadota bacterium]